MSNSHTSSHTAGHSHVRDYIVIFLSLTILTIVEVAITFVGLSPVVLTSILLVLAFIKAFLVAWYFMHLKYDAKFLAVIAGVPAFLICIAIAVIGYEWTHYTSTQPALNLSYIKPGEHATHDGSHEMNKEDAEKSGNTSSENKEAGHP